MAVETRREYDSNPAVLFDRVGRAQSQGWQIDRLWWERRKFGWWRVSIVYFAWLVRRKDSGHDAGTDRTA